MEETIIKNDNLIKNSSLINLINVFAYLFFFVTGYISLLRIYYSEMFLNLIWDFTLNHQSEYNLECYVGIQMDKNSLFIFYISILIICLINLITLIIYFIKNVNIQKYYFGNISHLIFLPLILFACLNFFGYSKSTSYNFIDIPDVRLAFSFLICFLGIIFLFMIYYSSFIKNYEETKEENSKYLLKIFYEVLLIFYLYYFFHMIQIVGINGEIKNYEDYHSLLIDDRQLPFKFEIVMACIIETLFGLIGLVIIFFGKAFTYAFYQIFIYVAFLIIRADNEKIKIAVEHDFVEKKLNVYDYIISSIIIALTFFLMIYLICSMRKKYYLKYF